KWNWLEPLNYYKELSANFPDELMTKVANYFNEKSNDVTIYASGVSDSGNKLLLRYGSVISEKEENRKVYKLEVNKLVKGTNETIKKTN
ncbi:MAG: hypothetical protein ACK5NK_04830, partial [Niabella sp.]